jgi:serine/threonine protein kinase
VSAPARLGKYEITEVLGSGAMGVVYRGFDPGIHRTVAIKTIRRELLAGDRSATAMLARFRNEARAAGRLAHPGIVAVHDYGEDADVAYIAMEYVEGNSLREYFGRGVKFAERDAVSIVSQLLEALGHAHERRVWHRDIKPANLIVMMNGRVKVADFGIARIEASDLTQTGAVMGSPGYMAPEQYAARAIDHRADLFAAGVVFYQLLTGARPFVGTQEQIAYAVCHTEAPNPSAANPGRSLERYDAILAKALAKKPEERYQTAEALREAIVTAHAVPVRPAVSEDTVITEILRPAAAVEPSSPSRPQSVPSGPGSRSVPPQVAAAPRPWGWAIAAGFVVLATAAGVWYSMSRKAPAPPAPVAEPVAAPPATAPAPRAQADQEVVFWESVRNSTDPKELEVFLAKYPDGTFAALARLRLAAIETRRGAEAQRQAELKAKAAAAATPPPPERRAAAEPPRPESPKAAATKQATAPSPDREALFWDSVRNSTDPAELNAYLARYPQGAYAQLARARLATLAAAEAEAKRVAEARAAADAEAKRAAEAKARAAAEAKRAAEAKARAEGEAKRAAEAKAKAAAPEPPPKVAAAVPTRSALAPSAMTPGATRFDGLWLSRLSCDPWEGAPSVAVDSRAEIRGGEVAVGWGRQGEPGYNAMSGRIADDDQLVLAGQGISGLAKYRGQPYRIRLQGRFSNGRYEGTGTLGRRPCTLTLQR